MEEQSSLSQKVQELQRRTQDVQKEQTHQMFQTAQTDALIEVMYDITKTFVQFLKEQTLGVEVENPVQSVKTPDVEGVKKAVESLEKTLQGKDIDFSDLTRGLAKLDSAVNQLPERMPKPEFPESIEVSNLRDYRPLLVTLIETVKKMKPVFDPQIEVKASDVQVVNDFTEILGALDGLREAIESLDMPQPVFDTTPLEAAVMSVRQAIKEIKFPVPEYPTKITTIAPLVGRLHDELEVTYPTATTEKYTYKFDGNTVAVVDLTYTDSTKENLSSIVKSQ